MVTEKKLDFHTFVALSVGLIFYPVLYSTDFFGSILIPILPDEFVSSLYNDNERTEWWYFIASNLLYHWIPFLFIRNALKKNNEDWNSIGLNWSWFINNKKYFIGLLIFLIVSAIVIPIIYYGGDLPSKSHSGFVAPISSIERIVSIFVLAFTAAITEEVIFRGFAITRLKRIIPNAWFILPIVAISFVFIHGEIRSLGLTLNYLIFSTIFGAFFIFKKFKRLEVLIIVHFLINSSLVFAY